MKNKELIAELLKLDQEAEVYTIDDNHLSNKVVYTDCRKVDDHEFGCLEFVEKGTPIIVLGLKEPMFLTDKQIRSIPTLGFPRLKKMIEDMEELIRYEASIPERIDNGANEDFIRSELSRKTDEFLKRYFI